MIPDWQNLKTAVYVTLATLAVSYGLVYLVRGTIAIWKLL